MTATINLDDLTVDTSDSYLAVLRESDCLGDEVAGDLFMIDWTNSFSEEDHVHVLEWYGKQNNRVEDNEQYILHRVPLEKHFDGYDYRDRIATYNKETKKWELIELNE